MKPATLFLVQGIIVLLFGVPLMLQPEPVLQFYSGDWVGMNSSQEIISRCYGTLLIGLGVACLAARKALASHGRKALILGLVVGNFLLLFVHLYGTLSGKENMMGWSLVVLVLVLGLWSLAVYLREKVY